MLSKEQIRSKKRTIPHGGSGRIKEKRAEAISDSKGVTG